MLFALESESVRVSTIDASIWETLLQSRNCIASSYAYLTDKWACVAEILQTDDRINTRASQHGYRCYRDWNLKDGKHYLKPSFTLPSEAGALFLVHVHLSFGPYCFAVKAVADGRLEIFYECKVFKMTVDAFRDMLSECCEGFSTVFFCIQSGKPIMTSSDEELLDLVAGGPLPQCDLLGGAEKAEADVDVGDQLRDLLQTEVKDLLKSLETAKGSAFPSQVCPLCPWRRFDKRCLLVTHVTKHHSASKRFVASGTKQLRIIASMYDDDAVRNESPGNYLQRSAELLRQQVKPQCSSRKNCIDTHCRLCMGSNGPFFISTTCVRRSQNLRRVGNVYYNRSFANAFLCSAVASRCSFRQIAATFTTSATRSGGQLSSLLPEASHSFWCSVMEDLMQSPHMAAKMHELLNECEIKSEFEYLSIDATVKCMMKILGQARFNQSQEDREAAAIDDMNSVYKLLTVRGRSNAVLALRGIKSEASALIADALSSSFSSSQRLQVSHIASDCPSPEMLANLKAVCPNLKSLSLDAMHIVMVYEQNHNNRSTKGSRWLATVMNKFRNVMPDCSAQSWGPMYTGVEQISYTAEEKRLSALIVNKDMSEVEAKAVLEGMDPDVPYRTETQFLESMAAICSLFADEMTKTTFAGPTLHRLLVNLTTPAKIQWLFNDTRYRHACKMSQICLLPSGTTSNESLHHEINSWFREIVSWLSLYDADHFVSRLFSKAESSCELRFPCIGQPSKSSSSFFIS